MAFWTIDWRHDDAQNGQTGAQDNQVGTQDGQVDAQNGQVDAQDGQVGAQDGQVGAINTAKLAPKIDKTLIQKIDHVLIDFWRHLEAILASFWGPIWKLLGVFWALLAASAAKPAPGEGQVASKRAQNC